METIGIIAGIAFIIYRVIVFYRLNNKRISDEKKEQLKLTNTVVMLFALVLVVAFMMYNIAKYYG